MMYGIRTKFKGPTNSTGSRIVASSEGSYKTTPYDHSLSSADNHMKAAEALMYREPLPSHLTGMVHTRAYFSAGEWLHIFSPKGGE
jgi:hypothetical protein